MPKPYANQGNVVDVSDVGSHEQTVKDFEAEAERCADVRDHIKELQTVEKAAKESVRDMLPDVGICTDDRREFQGTKVKVLDTRVQKDYVDEEAALALLDVKGIPRIEAMVAKFDSEKFVDLFRMGKLTPAEFKSVVTSKPHWSLRITRQGASQGEVTSTSTTKK